MIAPTGSFTVCVVPDLAGAKAFYTGHLGFAAVFENEWYLHLAAASGVQVGFMLPDQPTQPVFFHGAVRSAGTGAGESGKAEKGNGFLLSLEVADADAAYAEARAAGLDIAQGLLRSEDWGQRRFVLRDPNGVLVDIVQSLEPTEEYKKGYLEG